MIVVTSSDRPKMLALQLRFRFDPFPMVDRDASIEALGVWLAGGCSKRANSGVEK